jgi:hypothetical protein
VDQFVPAGVVEGEHRRRIPVHSARCQLGTLKSEQLLAVRGMDDLVTHATSRVRGRRSL